MALPEDRLDRVRFISRLYELVNSLTEDQQISLLQKMFHDDLPDHIFKMIMDMSEAKQLLVTNQLEEMLLEQSLWDEKVTVVDIDPRRGSRKPCVIMVDFSSDELSAQEYIRDISVGGAFIKTDQPLVIGQEVALSFSVPNIDHSLDLTGKVVRCNGEGIGVKFTNLTKRQQDMIMSIIETMDES